jgi:ABC-type transport system substrate-binding protein
MPNPAWREGDVLVGKYRVERTLSTGGMGTVVAATHLELHEPVCLKFMTVRESTTREDFDRFMREARAAARLRSEHVCRVMDVARLTDNTPFIVMEMLNGSDLAQLVKEHGPLTSADAAALIVQACEGLGEAHAAGIIHRDIKPSNLFVSRRRDGVSIVKVLDFGIAKAPIGSEAFATRPDQLMGTPAYMSPEQMMSSATVDARTDVWGLGAVLYELVTARTPFGGTSAPEVIAAVLTATPDLTLLPADIAPIVARCLARDRNARYQTVAELAIALQPLAGHQLSTAPTIASTTASLVRPRRPRRMWWIAAAAVVAAALTFAALMVVSSHKTHGPRRGGTVRLAVGFDDGGWELYTVAQSRNRHLMGSVVESLMRTTPDGTLEPWTIDRAEVRGPHAVVLHVRLGLWFHDHPCVPGGRLATAEDVAYSIQLANDSGLVHVPFAAMTVQGPDEVELDAPAVPPELAGVYLVPRELAHCDREDIHHLRQPVGTGPFRFAAPAGGAQLHLVRSPHYWKSDDHGEPVPYIDGIDVEPIVDVRQAVTEVDHGTLDAVEAVNDWKGMLDLSAPRAKLAAAYAGLHVEVAEGAQHQIVALLCIIPSTRQGPLADVRVRRALAIGIDRPALLAASKAITGVPANRFIPEGTWGFDPTVAGFPHDLERARALVREVGPLAPIRLASTRDPALLQAFVEQAKAIGLDVEVARIDAVGVPAALANGDGILVTELKTKQYGQVDPTFEMPGAQPELAELEHQLAVASRSERLPLYRRIEQVMIEDATAIPIAWVDDQATRPAQVAVLGRRLQNVSDPVTGFVYGDFTTAWLASP